MPNQAHRDVFTAFPGTRLPSSSKRPDWHNTSEKRQHPTSKRPDWNSTPEKQQRHTNKCPGCNNAKVWSSRREMLGGVQPTLFERKDAVHACGNTRIVSYHDEAGGELAVELQH